MNNNNYFEIDFQSKKLKRSRASAKSKDFNFLIDTSENQIIEKLKNFKDKLDFVLEIGSQGNLGNFIRESLKVKNQLTVDISIPRLIYNNRDCFKLILGNNNLPFQRGSFSAIVSCLYIDSSVNSKTLFSQIYNILNKEGFLIISLFGSNTLKSFKENFIMVEERKFKGISLRFHPLFELQKIGDLLKEIGFKNVIVETEIISVKYDSIFKLMSDLRGMGLTNSLKNRSKLFTPKSIFLEIESKFFSESNENSFMEQFEIITLTAWKN